MNKILPIWNRCQRLNIKSLNTYGAVLSWIRYGMTELNKRLRISAIIYSEIQLLPNDVSKIIFNYANLY
jgi:hypothetical protein